MKVFSNFMNEAFNPGSLTGMFDRYDNDDFGLFGGAFSGMKMPDMEAMMSKALQNGESGGTQDQNSHFVMQTYSMSKQIGPDGKEETKKYFANKMGARDQQGRRFGELQEMYDGGRGNKMIAQERTLGGNGRRIVKTKGRDGVENVREFRQGLGDQDIGRFDQEWGNAARRIGWDGKFGKPSIGYGQTFQIGNGAGPVRRGAPAVGPGPKNGLPYR